MDKRQQLVEQAIVLINEALEIEDDPYLTDAGEILCDFMEEITNPKCIECHCPLNENGKGKRKNMCPECFEEMCRDAYYQRLLDERRDEGRRF